MPTNGGVSDVEILGTSVPDLRGDKTGPEENLVSRKWERVMGHDVPFRNGFKRKETAQMLCSLSF